MLFSVTVSFPLFLSLPTRIPICVCLYLTQWCPRKDVLTSLRSCLWRPGFILPPETECIVEPALNSCIAVNKHLMVIPITHFCDSSFQNQDLIDSFPDLRAILPKTLLRGGALTTWKGVNFQTSPHYHDLHNASFIDSYFPTVLHIFQMGLLKTLSLEISCWVRHNSLYKWYTKYGKLTACIVII